MVWTWRIQGIVSLAIILRYRWWAAAVMAMRATFLFQLARRYNNDVTDVAYGRTDRLRRSHYLRSLALSGTTAKETRVFGLADWLVAQYRATWLSVMTDIWAKRRQGLLLGLGVAALILVVQGGVLFAIARSAAQSTIGLGTAVAAAQAVLAVGVLWIYDDGHLAIGQAERSIGRIRELEQAATQAAGDFSRRPATVAPAKVGRLPEHTIRFEHVTFTYPGRSEPVLDGLDLEIQAGRSLAIVGENGAGKTTFVKLLARLYEPTAGRITVDGIDLADIPADAWQQRIAAVFQDFVCFELTAYDNVAFGGLRSYDNREAALKAVRDAGALPIIDRLQHGWETTLSRQFSDGAQLSGGEWQRLALARALFGVATGAGVLVLDEPTASLDVRGEAEVYQRFLELTRGVTTIVISHRFSTVRRADRIVVVEHGRVIEDGNHEQLLAVGGRYASMYNLQAARFSTEDLVDA